ncbi:conserved protein, unknown function [Hepatocystis sp. ex Piliocolobus tephrosceles]|nr:conserved protein, unknown function [Hepatocystis sp. ex Piliocolobus tephrosceles]
MQTNRCVKYLFMYLLFFLLLGNCKKIKKNNKLRNLLKTLTEPVESDDGKNEYARLTQTPMVTMNLSKVKYTTSLQNTLVEPYAEKIKEYISARKHEIDEEKSILEEIKHSNYNLSRKISILLFKDKNKYTSKNNIYNVGNNNNNTYLNSLKDSNEDFGLNFFPVYKTFKSNPSHFNENMSNNVLHEDLLKRSYGPNTNALKNSSTKLFFPERGDIAINI